MSASRRTGFVLPIVLVLVGLLALTMAGYMFFVHAELAGVAAQRDGEQARLAAESGLEEVITILRESADDPSTWYDDPTRFRHALVWSETYRREDDPVRRMGSRKDMLGQPALPAAWRYSVVATIFDGTVDTFRYGITPEASKLNLNTASDQEIERLVTPLLLDLGIENAPELVAALLDWMDEDSDTRPAGAEDDWYTNLKPGYHCKNGDLETVEELLLVKGWTSAALYGEDVNRNGLLDRNENDGDASFPYYDNGNGLLDRGVAPYVTVWSHEPKPTDQNPGGGPGPGGQPSGAPDGGDGGGDETGGKDGAKQQSKDPNAGDDPNQAEGDEGDGAQESEPGGVAGSGGEQDLVRAGLVDVNTAPLRVLQALDGMPEGVAEALVAARQELTGEALAQADWLLTTGAMDAGTYAQVKDRVTTRALQFHVEIIGYGDHTKVARRYEWIVDLRGPIAQVLYHRDLTGLGLAWPIDDERYMVSGGR